MRSALKDVTLTSAGTPIMLPAGTICISPETAIHRDPDNYADPDTFDAFRFAEMRGEKGSLDEDKLGGLKHQFVSTSVRYVPFGHGKHSWRVFFLLRSYF